MLAPKFQLESRIGHVDVMDMSIKLFCVTVSDYLTRELRSHTLFIRKTLSTGRQIVEDLDEDVRVGIVSEERP